MGWKRIRCIDHNKAAELTCGNTDKFMNKDFWTLGQKMFKNESEIDVGVQAVYYHDGTWWVVEKVR